MLYIVLISILGIILVRKNKNNYVTHILLSILMYGLYVYLWFLPTLVSKTYDKNKHPVDSALGVAVVFIFSIPIYLLIHSFFIWYSKKKVMWSKMVGGFKD